MTLDYTVYLLREKTKRHTWPWVDLSDIDEVTAEYHRLVISGEPDPEDRRKKASDGLRNKWYEHVHREGIRVPLRGLLSQIAEPELPTDTWVLFPSGSFFLRLTLALAKPLITHGDNHFYVIENPVAKDIVFKQPMMRSTSWKGLLRYAMRLQRKQDQTQLDDEVIIRLFGTEKKVAQEGNFQAGRLTFFTTFFNATDLEVLNPHIRERKVGRQPIPIECIRQGARGEFHLLYTPFDLLNYPDRLPETMVDLEVTIQALRDLMLDLGFSAKRTSGYGVIRDDNLNGTLRIKTEGRILRGQFNTFSELEQLVEVFHERMRGEQSDG